jgi:hypothetical protein
MMAGTVHTHWSSTVLRDTDLDELYKGQIVHLDPHTKTASRACHEKRVVRIMHDQETIRKHWPMVVVEWKVQGIDVWERVHRDNIKLRPKTTTTKVEKREGDGTQSDGRTASKWARVRKAPGRPTAVIEDQMELF